MSRLRFLSVCSGIEAASVAWRPLGWEAVAFSEIEAFPSALLAHHYPTVPNYGDMTRFKDWPDAAFDLLVGGTPCQSFSVAGLRKGLDDPRGSLMLVYLAIAQRHRPRWLVWENVPGVLSADGGRAFGSLLGGLAELGYGFAYRVLDAQYFGLAQRRKRVFVVGCLGDWRRAAAVLFERESLSGHSAPRREAGERVAPTIGGCSNGGGANGPGRDVDSCESLITGTIAASGAGTQRPAGQCNELDFLIAHYLRADGFDASEDGTGRGTPIVPVTAGTLKANNGGGGWSNSADHAAAGYMIPIAMNLRGREDGAQAECSDVASLRPGQGYPAVAFNRDARADELDGRDISTLTTSQAAAAAVGMTVRRLTPLECERLQGFPDNYTLIPYRGKPAKDGPRYKALGNSMAVPVMAWIGQRIQMVEQIANESAA